MKQVWVCAAGLFFLCPSCHGQTVRADAPAAPSSLPELPQPRAVPKAQARPPQALATPPALNPCLVKRAAIGTAYAAARTAALSVASAVSNGAAPGAAATMGTPVTRTSDEINAALVPCTAGEHLLSDLQLVKKLPLVNWYARFLDGPQVKPMTPKEKAWLAVRNVADPFNTITILASSGLAVASNSHSPYGPGMTGFGRYVGVSYTQDMTGEFIGTFLIPSIVHQDPHYHRMPNASIKRRIAHVLYQVVWTQGDNARGMVNYADVVGFGIDDEIANLYVPGRETDARASAERYATALALAPTDNAITEFLPDIARRIHVRVVFIQQIINQVAKTGSTAQ